VPRLHLVRHGQAAAGWGDDPDPGLSDLGARQARQVARRLAADLGARPILTSPLRRARETAEPLATRWTREVRLEAAVGEVPSPTTDLVERDAWLREALQGRWAEMGPDVDEWRAGLLDRLRGIDVDAVVVTHFVAINAVVTEADGTPDVTAFLPAHTSVTVVDVDAGTGALTVVSRGSEAPPDLR
jgi:broad specificity phosphatase PhoE